MIAGLVLAAGASVRMGGAKIGLDIGGKPMLLRVVETAIEAGLSDVVVVVAGAGDAGRDALLRLPADARAAVVALGPMKGVRVAQNPDALTGQASSLRIGLRAMRHDADAAMILLADQPTIRADAIRAVTGAFEAGGGPVVQAAYGGRPAHPTLLARSIWPELEQLVGDVGARDAIARHPEWRTLVEVGGAVPADVDTPGDYLRLVADLGRQRGD